MIKVLQERQVKKKKWTKLIAQLNDLRSVAVHQPGYITGETLFKGKDPIDVLVISTWISEDHWKAWLTSEERIELNDIVDSIIETDTKISIYQVPTGQE
jgi:heme-degrading monooxygenase HmoA